MCAAHYVCVCVCARARAQLTTGYFKRTDAFPERRRTSTADDDILNRCAAKYSKKSYACAAMRMHMHVFSCKINIRPYASAVLHMRMLMH